VVEVEKKTSNSSRKSTWHLAQPVAAHPQLLKPSQTFKGSIFDFSDPIVVKNKYIYVGRFDERQL
jgi:hypothetical protein